jgi:hypothetical protein
MLCVEIEDYLIAHFDLAPGALAQAIEQHLAAPPAEDRAAVRRRVALRRIQARASGRNRLAVH